jgi:hypothetical protein
MTTFGFANETSHSELILQKIVMISNLVNDRCEEDVTTLGFP